MDAREKEIIARLRDAVDRLNNLAYIMPVVDQLVEKVMTFDSPEFRAFDKKITRPQAFLMVSHILQILAPRLMEPNLVRRAWENLRHGVDWPT